MSSLHTGVITNSTTSFIIGVVIATVQVLRYSELNTMVAGPGTLRQPRFSVSLRTRHANKIFKKKNRKVINH